MKPFGRGSIDAPGSPISVKKGGHTSLNKVATISLAALTLLGAEVSKAGVVTLPIGVNSISVGGNISGPTSTGGAGDYMFYDNQGNVLFTGTGVLGTPIEGQPYTVTFEAMREGTNEVFNMFMEFPDLRFTGSHNFEAGSLNLQNSINSSFSNSNYVVGYWDNSGFGDIGMTGTAYTQAVPEPATYALVAAGLGAVGLATRRRRSTTTTSPTTIPATKTPKETVA